MRNRIKPFIGNKAFYVMVISIVLPIIIQNAITNFVSLLDNLMVGRLGTESMSGVAIANQLFYVFTITIFGAVSGAGIFAAQFYGAGNHEGVKMSFRYKLYLSIAITIGVIVLLLSKGQQLISLYLNDTGNSERVLRTMSEALPYMRIMLVGLLPFAITQCYASTLRETGETRIPMFAGLVAVGVNMVFNYLLIFGILFFPAMGVKGAAYATVLSRFVELGIIAGYTHTHKERYRFAVSLYSGIGIPANLVRDITKCSIPLLANELLWSLGQTVLVQTYSLRGLDVVAAMNISTTVFNLFAVAYFSLGTAAAIIIGQALGADDTKRARDYVKKMLGFSVMVSVSVAIIVASISGAIPFLYNVEDGVRFMATRFIRSACMAMPLMAIANCCYFIIRSGGKTGITFLFDCVFSWVVSVPVAMALVRLTSMDVVHAYLFVLMCDILKCVIGVIMLKKGIWIRNIVGMEK